MTDMSTFFYYLIVCHMLVLFNSIQMFALIIQYKNWNNFDKLLYMKPISIFIGISTLRIVSAIPILLLKGYFS